MDVGHCRRVIEREFPQIHVDKCVQLYGGWSSEVFEVNDELIFRFPKSTDTENRLQKEINLLPELAEALSVQIPHFDSIGRHRSKLFVGYRKISGLPVARVLPDHSYDDLSEQLAKVITEIHSFSADRAAKLRVLRINWQSEYSEFYQRTRKNALPLMGKTLQERAVSTWEAFLNDPRNFQFEPVFIHRDLSGEAHILCDPDKMEITGIIDWEDAAIGDPAIDFTGIYWDCGEEFAKQVVAKYARKVDETFWERMVFYYKIGPFYQIEYGQLTDDHVHIKKGLNELSRTLYEDEP